MEDLQRTRASASRRSSLWYPGFSFHAPPHFVFASSSAGCRIISARAIVRAATGLSQSRAMKAANKSQATIAQKTGTQLPVLVDAKAATGPTKIDANPLLV